MNNMIPIGWMRTGLHLERAFLFKVLADKLGLPASLVRGTYLQRAWIEVITILYVGADWVYIMRTLYLMILASIALKTS